MAISGDVTDKKPKGIRRLGEEIVLWRDLDGKVVCQGARCPHKGAWLGDGRMKGNAIECPYHGFLFNPEGKCTLTPAMGKNARIPGSLKVPVYPVREKYGLIWVWWGDDRPESELPEIIAPREIRENDRVYDTISWNKPVHYTRYIESVQEFYHVTYVHRDHWLNWLDFMFLYGTKKKFGLDGKENYLKATMIHNHHVETDDDGMTFRYSFDHGEEDNPERSIHYVITFSFPCMVHVETEAFATTSWFSPIDEEHTEHIFRVYEFPQLKPILRHEKLRRAMSTLQCYLEKYVQDPQDYKIMARQEPRISGGGVNKFIPVDEMNAKFIKTRARLLREARERREGTVTAGDVSDGMVGDLDMATDEVGPGQPAALEGKRRTPARSNGRAKGNGQANGRTNGHANGSGANGNGSANGGAATNGSAATNGRATNGRGNSAAVPAEQEDNPSGDRAAARS
ncbi:Rieske 2Fe-2S domain-containing protein [Streptomyces sp. NPDC053499]|uniref:Rieske 2Fe-2S domain-containing protein n=1 Tax=Streptomyces sp. NPDC053499 TaxID=3365707 RepID=UPI0037D2CC32